MAIASPFGVEFESLTLDGLKAVLPPGEYEPLSWEAKGTKATRESIRREVCGFANSRSGGVLILGADQPKRGGPWTWDGVHLSSEPVAWLDQVIRDGLSPVPEFTPRILGNGSAGPVAAIRVWPVPDPPCITLDGQVFERVPGRTIPVATSADLTRLFEQGRAARNRAESAALRGVERARTKAPESEALALYAVSLAATGLPASVRSTIYRESFVDFLRPVVSETTGTPRAYVRARATFEDRAVLAWLFDFNRVEGAFVIVDESGTVTVGYTDPDVGEEHGHTLLTHSGQLHRAWSTALKIAKQMGCYGSAFVCVSTGSRRGEVSSSVWTHIADEPQAEDLASMLRDLARSQGDAAWEPE